MGGIRKKRRQFSEEHRRKLSEAHKGKRFSEETRRRMSEAKRGKNNPWYGKRGENHPRYGKHHSEEARRKISKAMKKPRSYSERAIGRER